MRINTNFLGKIILFVETAVLSAVCFFLVHKYSDPTGGDGYFYLKQIKILSDQFKFYHSDYSLFFVFAAIFKKIGASDLLSYQLTTVFSFGLLIFFSSLIIYEKLKIFEKDIFNILLSFVFLILFSSQKCVLKLCFEFAKNGLAIAFFVTAIYFLDKKKLKHFLLLCILAVFTHKTVFVYLTFVTIFIFFDKNLIKSYKKVLFCLAVSLVLILSISIYFKSRLFIHILDFKKNIQVEKILFTTFENQLIPLALVGLTFLWSMLGLYIYFKKINHDRLKLSIVSGVSSDLHENKKIEYDSYRFIFIFSLFSLVPFLPIFSGYNLEIKFRLFLNSFIFGFLVFCFSLKHVKNLIFKKIYVVFVVSVLIFQAFQYSGFPWIINWSSKIKNLDLLSEKISKNNLVITHHGLQFYIDYKTMFRARSLLTPGKTPDYQIAYTPIFYKLSPDLADEIKQIEILSLGESYGLFNYNDFQSLMREFPLLADWRNQFQIRPDFVQSYDQ